MKRRSVVVLLIFALLLIGGAVFLIYTITTGETARFHATTSFTVTTRFTTHESTSPDETPPVTMFSSTTVATRTATNTAILSTSPIISTTNAPTSATSATSFSSSTTSSSVTMLTSQVTESTVDATTFATTTAKEVTGATVPKDTTVTESTMEITTTNPPWTDKSTTKIPASTSEASEATSEQTTTEIETTKAVTTTTEVATDMDTTTHATVTPCDKFNYVVKDPDTGVACVQANMTIQINLQYMTNYCRTNEATLTVPKEAKTSGVCGEKTAEMTLSWKTAAEDQVDDNFKENKVTFRYAHDDSKYFLDSTSVDVQLGNGKRIKEDTTNRHFGLFSTSMKHEAFIRQLGAEINIGDRLNVLISNISLIAFAGCSEASSRTDGNYNTAGANVNNGPIVGGTIGAIVLILIIFFLIWRKRKKNATKPQHNLP